MTGLELPGYVGIMKEQCGGCVACGACGSGNWALIVLVAVGVYLVGA